MTIGPSAANTMDTFFANIAADIAIRSYDAQETADRHPFAQLVLPLRGAVQLDIEGACKRLDPFQGAVVVAGAFHAQYSLVENRSLIVDLDQAGLEQGEWSRLADRPFTDIGPAARKLVEFMQISMEAGSARPALLQGWMPLLLDSLAQQGPQPRSRLGALLAQIDAQPALPWTAETMARFACMSASRLHALFREELETTPRAWLLRKRLDLACALLGGTARPIADIALATGFADQSVLTRAMRQHLDMTPAAYRRLRQETAHKTV